MAADGAGAGVPGRDADGRVAEGRVSDGRVAWVDYAKGLCIIMVAMMHSTLGVEAAAGQESWLHGAILFAQPFRMPDFFLISGLFLARVIGRDWRSYLDTKLFHFLYFYLLWAAIQWGAKSLAPALAAGDPASALPAFVAIAWEPQGALWFIYLLPAFFIVTKLLRAVSPPIVLGIAALLQVLPIDSGWFIADEFCDRFVFFLVGFYLSSFVFGFADHVARNKGLALAGLVGWAVANGALVVAGVALAPGVGLVLGLVGALAVVAVSVLLREWGKAPFLRYAGQNSIVVFLSFFLPMAVTRAVLLKVPGLDLGTVSLLVSAVAVVAPLLAFRIVKGTWLGFLYERPEWTRVVRSRRRPAATLVPAE
jgi:uncharacterized membrane protein YcfT